MISRRWAGALLVGVLSGVAQADMRSLMLRLPAEANAVVAIDVAQLRQAPLAKSEEWGKKAEVPLFLPPGTDRLVLGVDLSLAKMEPAWQVGVADMDKPISTQNLVMVERGAADSFGTTKAVLSPRGAYFLVLDSQVLGVATPSDRQLVSRWVKQLGNPARPKLPTNLQDAIGLVREGTQVAIGMDLTDAVSANQVRKALNTHLSRATLVKDLPAETVANVMTSLKGLSLQFQVGEDITGQMNVDFGVDPSAIVPVAGTLLVDITNHNGVGIKDLESWKVKARGKQLVFEGKLSSAAFLHVMGFFEPMSPAEATVSPGAPAADPTVPAPQPTADDAQKAVVTASQKYFKSISGMIDSFGPAPSLAEGAAWMRRTATRIDKLPILNVDPELLGWGTEVSALLLDAAQQLAVGQTQVNARVAGAAGANVIQPGTNVYYQDNNGNYQADQTAQTKADWEKQTLAKRQAAMEEKSRVQAGPAKMLADLQTSRGRMRVTMVQRYKVEF